MESFVVLLVIAGVVIPVIVRAVRRHQRKVEAAWRRAASDLGLAYTAGRGFQGRCLEGELDGQHVRVDIYTRRSGQHSQTYTRYRVTYPRPLGLGLRLKRETVWHGIARFLGAQDVEVGDGEFDASVVVKGNDPRRLVDFLTPSRRLRILRLFHALDGCEIGDEGIAWSSRGVETDPARLAAHVRRIVHVAGFLGGDRETGRALDRAVEAKREGRLDEALEAARDVGGDPDARMVEGEILYTGGRFQEAEEAFRRGTEQSGGDTEMEAWAARAAERFAAPPPPADAPPPEPEGEAASGGALGPDAGTVCDELFDPKVLSLEASRRFEERYRGAQVRWSGCIRRADAFAFDLVFGSRPGTKLILELREAAGGIFSRTVQAVLALPPEALQDLQRRSGERVTFEGKLLGCDAFSRNLFVTDARLL